MSGRIIAFEPVAPPGARALILGSMPSVESLNQGFYDAHPRNAFWHILAQICNEPFPEDIPARIALLERHDLALWDVLASCERQGSLDSAI
ncbi:MAG: DNA-deoxyinosine glycosylase, partial [Clostridia bacterium]|nr:DNA-deoxyinosine glycosylase [Clostridia bacterium]